MAKKTFVELIDDMDGSKAETTVRFSWQGASYEIDLSKKNAKAFETAVGPYLAKATRAAAGRGGRRSSARGKSDLSGVRTWAATNGFELASRGRIPANILEAYQAAQGSGSGRASAGTKAAAKKGTRRRTTTRKG